jgi:hypothetical protein
MIPDDRELLADLTGVEYGYVLGEGREGSRDNGRPRIGHRANVLA